MNKRSRIHWSLLALGLTLWGCHSNKVATVKEGPAQAVPVQELYEKGQAALDKDHPAQARRYFDQISLREDAGEYKEKAAIGTADAYFQENSLEGYAEAISRYQSFLAFHPTHPQAPYCEYQVARAYMEQMGTPERDQGAAKNAEATLLSLMEHYPKSAEAKEAQARLREVRDNLAAHEIRVGDFYLKRGHPLAAAARYRVVLQTYTEYWNMPLVQSRMGEALYRAGNNAEAAIYFRRVLQEAPERSSMAKTAQKRLARIEKGEKSEALKADKGDLAKEPLVPEKGKEPSKEKEQEKEKPKRWWQFWK